MGEFDGIGCEENSFKNTENTRNDMHIHSDCPLWRRYMASSTVVISIVIVMASP